VANGVPRLELSGIVTFGGLIVTSNSGAGLQPGHVAMHINASNDPGNLANCFIVRSLPQIAQLLRGARSRVNLRSLARPASGS